MKLYSTIKKISGRGILFASLAFASCDGTDYTNVPQIPQIPPVIVISRNYSIETLNREDSTIEHRLFKKENNEKHHFMTIIENKGAFVLRPHPGKDANGWGSSLYMQPFLPGAVLRDSIVKSLTADDEALKVEANGIVSRNTSLSYGNWNFSLNLKYNQQTKKIQGSGIYSISLEDLLNDATGDLNLLKIASNYLDDVPLLSGGIGDTGDMERADVTGKDFSFSWNPAELPAHFPYDLTDNLLIDLKGKYNNVDTKAQGYARIEEAYKPGLKLILKSKISEVPMIFGAIYDTNKSKSFWEDNVGITPLILKSSTKKILEFDVEFESEALAGDK